MIKSLHTILSEFSPSLKLELNDSETKLLVDNGKIEVSTIENLFEIRYQNYIHYTPRQIDVLGIIKDKCL